ncbi:MAG: hypothetical protein HKO89_08580 [Saprospiraceae bacterium]|nr:hypothetical protein [Saprospiraceae bacterium]
MKLEFSITPILILSSLLISCNGQIKSDNKATTVTNSPEPNIISVPENGFSSGLLDNKGNIWFTSNGGGVFFFDGTAFTNYTKEDVLSSNQVFSIIEDNKNNLWFGTQNGLTSYNGTRFELIPLPFQDTTSAWLDKVYPVINPNAAHALAVDQDDNIWIGTAGGGAYRYDGKYFKSFLSNIGRKQEDSLYHNWIPFIREDKEGHLWFASMTHGGVHRFDGEKFTQFLTKDGLSDNQVRTIYCDKSGNIWIGFNGNRNSGLTVYDGKTFKTYSEADGLCNKRIRAIYEDKSGNIWLGASLGKLCIFDGQNFSEFISNGLTYSDILFILNDSEDNVWFGGKNGIWKFDGRTAIKMTQDNS